MRALAEVAIDQAGFSLVDELQQIEIPADLKLVGSISGDLQSLDAEGQRTFYYLRPVKDKAVPKWLGNLARASHSLKAGPFYIVVRDYHDSFAASCRENGAGLLRLTAASSFEVVVDYSETSPKAVEAAVEERITELRRQMERRVEMARTDIESRYAQSAGIIATMEFDAAERYKNRFESEFRSLDDWGMSMSQRLDGLGGSSSAADIDKVAELISAGPKESGSA